MYLAKARKQMEEQDMKEIQSKADKRSDATRAGSQQVKRGGIGDIGIGVRRGSSSRDDFQPDDLPDGAFVSPKHTPTQVKPEEMTIERPAEYIGSFSVCGTDEDTRALQVETQLQSLQTVQQGKPVELQINLQGVQVSDSEDQSVLMHHELKRISYAACDPQHHQFSFLAREKHLNIQYCHTFRTTTPEQAEELNVIMGDAFKMAYAHQRDTLPTFHELIEAQIVEQQARFREIERQAHAELQRKLAEIARPTPFSQQAIQWMEQRKVPAEEGSDTELLVGKNKLWAKHAVDQVHHRVSSHETGADDSIKQSVPGGQSDPVPFFPQMLRRREAIGLKQLPSSDAGSSTSVDFRASLNLAKHLRSIFSEESSSTDVLSEPSLNLTKHNSSPFPQEETFESRASVIGHTPVEASDPVLSHAAHVDSGPKKRDVRSKISPVKVFKSAIGKRFVRSMSDTAGRKASLPTEADSNTGERRDRDRRRSADSVVPPENRPLPTAPPVSSPVSSTSSTSSRAGGEALPPPQRPPALAHQRHHSLEDDDPHLSSSPQRKPPQPSSDSVVAAMGPGLAGGRPVGKRHDNWQLVDMLGTAVESKTALALEAEPKVVVPRVLKPPRRSPPPEPPPTPPESPVCLLSPSQLPTPVSESAGEEEEEEEEDEECVWPDLPPPGDLILEELEEEEEEEIEEEKKIVTVLESPEKSECLSDEGRAEGGSDDRSESSPPVIAEDPTSAFWFSKGMMESSMSLDRREIEDPSLRQAPWYQPGIPREIALEILQQDVVGSFIVRDSATHLGCFALSVRVPETVSRTGVSHYVIAKNPKGFRLKGGSNKDFASLTALVSYHTHTADNMPCKLRLLHNARNLTFMAAEREDSEEDAGHTSLESDDLPSSVDQMRLSLSEGEVCEKTKQKLRRRAILEMGQHRH